MKHEVHCVKLICILHDCAVTFVYFSVFVIRFKIVITGVIVLHLFDPVKRWVFNSISFDGIANLLYLMRELDFQPLSSDIRRISEWNISNMFEKKIFYATRKTNWHILGKTIQFEKLGNALYPFTIELDSILLVFFS